MAPHPDRQALTREVLEQTAGFLRQAVFRIPEQTKRREAGRQQRMTQTLDRSEDSGMKLRARCAACIAT